MTLRIGLYNTVVGITPTVVGAAFNTNLYSLNTVMSNNFNIQQNRDGTRTLIHDSLPHFPVELSLTIAQTHIDNPSLLPYIAQTRYLGPTLYNHYTTHDWVVLFHENINGKSKKAYLGKIIDFDQKLAAQVTVIDTAMMGLKQWNNSGPLTFKLDIQIDGVYTDINDVMSATWIPRV